MITLQLVIAIVLEVGNSPCLSHNSSISARNEKKAARSFATKFRKSYLIFPNERFPNHTIFNGKKNCENRKVVFQDQCHFSAGFYTTTSQISLETGVQRTLLLM